MEKLIALKTRIETSMEDARAALEEAEECGDLEERFVAAFRLARLEERLARVDSMLADN